MTTDLGGYPADNERANPSESDVDFEAQQGGAGLREGAEDPAGAPVPAAGTDREPVGRVEGQDTGYDQEQGAERRAAIEGEGIGGAAGGRM